MKKTNIYSKSLIVFSLLFIVIIFSCNFAFADWNEEGSPAVQETLWDILMDEFDNPIAAAAVMGNVAVESNYCPWRYSGDNDVENSYNQSLEYVNRRSKSGFIYYWENNLPGFGLFQFSTNTHMENLWNLAEEQGVAVYDVKLQTDYMLQHFKESHPEAYQALKESTDLVDATEIFRSFAECSYCTEKTMNNRTKRAVEAYEKFTGQEYGGEIYTPTHNGGSLWELKFERK